MMFGQFYSPHPMSGTPSVGSSPVLPRTPPVAVPSPPRGLLTPVQQESLTEKTPTGKAPSTPNFLQQRSILSQIPEEPEQQPNVMATVSKEMEGFSTPPWRGRGPRDITFSPLSTPGSHMDEYCTPENPSIIPPVANTTPTTSLPPMLMGPGVVCITIRRADHDVPLGLD